MAVLQALLPLLCPSSIRKYRQISPLLLTLLLTIADTSFLGALLCCADLVEGSLYML
jgi:hypothetical protein